MKKQICAAGLAVLCAGGALWRVSAGVPQELDPLKVAADTHKLVFENPFVRVLETRVPPGKTEPWHRHGRRVVVYLTDFNTRSTERGGKPQDNLRKAGLARWSEPVVHQVENIGKTEGHVISVELK
ncbi:MAG: cytoplasmic protein [Acidobacteria bacterium]|nr:MAG: cytoplasmic protein [Acidobacteriota bacterium]